MENALSSCRKEFIKSIASDMGIELYHLALAWVLSNPVLSVALVGARTPAEVEANMGALEVEFSADQRSALQAVFDPYHVDTQPDLWVE
jgi:aryl-alcohol dehydrogenase-like predicted oxidoreductase